MEPLGITHPSVATSPHMAEAVVGVGQPGSHGEQVVVVAARLRSARMRQGAQAATAVPPAVELLVPVVLLVKTVRHSAEVAEVRVEHHRKVDVLLGAEARAGLEVLVQVLLAVVGTRSTEVVRAAAVEVWTMLTLEHSKLEALAAGSMLSPTVAVAQAVLRVQTTGLLALRARRARASAVQVEEEGEARTQRLEELAARAVFQEALVEVEAEGPQPAERAVREDEER